MVFDSFSNNPGYIKCNVKTYEDNNLLKNDEIYFKLSEKILVNENLIAIVLSTFCGIQYDEIYFDLNINENVINDIASHTKAIVTVKNINNDDFINNRWKIALNFSGGFDSLSAKFLLDDYVELVSIDFKVDFLKNEANFLKKFSPYLIETNFRALGYDRNDWTFMGIGSILFSDFLNLKYHLFGTVFEADYIHSYYEFSSRNKFIEPPFDSAGLTDIKLIQGLTEIGTALILCNTQPYLVNDSLESLAQVGSEKRYRKQLIIKSIKNKFNLKDVHILPTSAPKNKRKWGTNIVEDFLTLYFIKYCGIDELNIIVENIPNEVLDFVENNSFDFYDKFNQNFLNNIPINIKQYFLKNLATAKIDFYDEKDFTDLKIVMDFLSKWYPYVKKYKHRL